MFWQTGNLHFGARRVLLVVGLLATIVAAVAIIGKKRPDGQQPVPLESWEEELGM
jgi:hypothetical protein